MTTPTKENRLREVASVFFKLGCVAFGGPAAHIAMMESELIEKRKWMSREHFLDLIGATNLIPGPNSTEMTMHCGHERAGTKGLFVAGLAFILPAIVITGLFAWLFVEYGQLPEFEAFVYGIKPAVLVIILGAVLKLGKKAVKNTELAFFGGLVLLASFLGVNEIMALLLAGVLGAIYFSIKNKTTIKDTPKKGIFSLLLPSTTTVVVSKLTTIGVFWTFAKVGAVLYGSGYVLFAYLDAELVSNGFLTEQQLIDAIAVGQFTPGPVLSTATFIGYQLNGFAGALAASAGIFLPSFLFVLLLNPLVPKMRKSKVLGYFLDTVNVAAVAVMVAVMVTMGFAVLTEWKAFAILGIALLLTYGPYKVNAMWIIVIGALSGYLLSFI